MTEPTETEKLQREIDSLRAQLADARAQNYKLDSQLRACIRGNNEWGTVAQSLHNAELYYWIGKCQRQRQAINHIQRRGWYPPEYVIREEDPWGQLTA
jgi:hypothetical protein